MQTIREEVEEYRTPEYDIDPLFVNRWSPRTMTGDSLAEEEFFPLFEAARWAPSSRNEQPWRFLYATRDSGAWSTYFDLLYDGNQEWAQYAAVLVVILSKTTFERNGKPNGTHSFDTGAAWANLALEGARRGLVVHGMAGFDHEKAIDVLNVPPEYDIEAMMAIGIRKTNESRHEDARGDEHPNGRKDLDQIVTQGDFDDETV